MNGAERRRPQRADTSAASTEREEEHRVTRERVREGDRSTFARLFDTHAKPVYNHAYRLTGDWSAAEEIMSETFLVAWRTRDRVEPGTGSLLPWLLGIATNKARNHRRGVGRRLALLARHPGPRPVEDFADASAARLDEARELAAVREVWHRLRRGEREVLVLRVWGELDYEQTAEALGVPVGTVRSRLSRARTRLRRLTEKRLAEERREPRTRSGEIHDRAALAAPPIEKEAR